MIHNHEKIIDKMILEFSKTIQLFGLTSLEARLFSYLYLADEPLTLDEMSEAMGKSKTTISTNIRNLLELNLVTRVWKKGVRKDLYEAKVQLYRSFMNFYVNKWMDATVNQKESLEETFHQFEQLKQRVNNQEEMADIESKLNDFIHFHLQLEKLFQQIRHE